MGKFNFKAWWLISLLILCSGCNNNQPTKIPNGRLYPVLKNGKYGYIDKTGTLIISPQFSVAWDFDKLNEFAPIEIDNWWRSKKQYYFIDSTGKILQTPALGGMGLFSDGLAAVEIGGKWGYIDKTGKIVIQPQFGNTHYINTLSFTEELAEVNMGGKWGFIDKTGKFVIPPQFVESPSEGFSEGLASANKGEKWGFIDKTGKFIIPAQFVSVGKFSEGLASIQTDSTCGYIDKTGKIVIPPQFYWAEGFSEGLAKVEMRGLNSRKYGFIDKTGKFVISPQFDDSCGNFTEGLAQAKKGGKYGYIDKTGKFIIPPQFDWTDGFTDGMARVIFQNPYRFGYIDKSGNYIWQPQN